MLKNECFRDFCLDVRCSLAYIGFSNEKLNVAGKMANLGEHKR